MEEHMERWALLLFFTIYFIATFAWRSWCVWRQTGLNPYVLPSGDDAPGADAPGADAPGADAQGYVAKAFRSVLLVMGAYAALQALWPAIDLQLGIFVWLAHPLIHATGWGLLLLSLLWVCVAQIRMGNSWRIGIDLKNPAALVRSGLFSLSRNPIFLAMRVSLLALLLVRPNGLTLALAASGNLLMQLQVRQEEAFLLQRHGDTYADYCRQTRRWL